MAGRIAIVCAMEQEVRPLVRGWRKVRDKGSTFFESEKAVLVVAGIGSAPAALAAMTLVGRERASSLMSVGLAGALRSDLRVGDVVRPHLVINVATGRKFETQDPAGSGVLLSGKAIAGEDRKRELREQFAADAIDMEGAGVASIADSCGLPFFVVKAISDEVEFAMPPLNNFVDAKGKLHMGAYALRAAVHPSWWSPTLELARNGHMASAELCMAVAHQIEEVSKSQSGALVPRT
ncbi:MAG TPA: hypothetical protein VGL89_01280 [Candidatus Koribacter sp.]|jgi:nucleoside phosphorylase